MKAVVEGCSPLPRGCVRGCVSRPEIRGKQRKAALTSLPGPALQPVGNKSRDRAAASCPGILCFVGERAPIGGLEFLISLSLLGANARPEIVYSHPDGLETEFTLPARSWFHGTPHFFRWADQRNGCSLGRPSEVRQERRVPVHYYELQNGSISASASEGRAVPLHSSQCCLARDHSPTVMSAAPTLYAPERGAYFLRANPNSHVQVRQRKIPSG